MRLFLAVVVGAAVSACSPAALVVVWPPSKWIPAIVAASYTPEKIDRGLREERPVLAEAISHNFPNEYLAILEEGSAQVRVPGEAVPHQLRVRDRDRVVRGPGVDQPAVRAHVTRP